MSRLEMSVQNHARVKLLEIRVHEIEYRQRIIFNALERILAILVEAGLSEPWEVETG